MDADKEIKTKRDVSGNRLRQLRRVKKALRPQRKT